MFDKSITYVKNKLHGARMILRINRAYSNIIGIRYAHELDLCRIENEIKELQYMRRIVKSCIKDYDKMLETLRKDLE